MAAKIAGNLDISSLVILTLVQFYQLKSASSLASSFFFFFFFWKCLIRPQNSLHFCQSSVRPKDLHQTGVSVTESFSLLFHANWSCRGGEGGGNCENTSSPQKRVLCVLHIQRISPSGLRQWVDQNVSTSNRHL